jgi:hypothetical protein
MLPTAQQSDVKEIESLLEGKGCIIEQKLLQLRMQIFRDKHTSKV